MHKTKYDLDRFLRAQERNYTDALAEIRAGEKVSHWMWYVFPQLRVLGKSDIAHFYGIADLGEAQAYLAHPVLSARLVEITEALIALDKSDPVRIMGSTDAKKLRSCMTLFAHATVDNDPFLRVLNKFYGGAEDPKTLEFLYT